MHRLMPLLQSLKSRGYALFGSGEQEHLHRVQRISLLRVVKLRLRQQDALQPHLASAPVLLPDQVQQHGQMHGVL